MNLFCFYFPLFLSDWYSYFTEFINLKEMFSLEIQKKGKFSMHYPADQVKDRFSRKVIY